MKSPLHTERYRVSPGEKVRLDKRDPNDTSGFDGTEADAQEELEKLRKRLDQLQELLYAEDRHGLLIILQAMDTGGKDGTVRRVFEGVNPSGVRVVHFREPTPEELAHDFLWRVHPHVPARGELVVFNRSHYEAVLVERVHGLVSPKACHHRYRQIASFEHLLSASDTKILKFFLHIDAAEQKRRLEERFADPSKHWKFSPADLLERKYWPEYADAYEHALEKTSTEDAPWYIIPANHKWCRDLLVASIIVDTLEGLHMRYPGLPKELEGLRIK